MTEQQKSLIEARRNRLDAILPITRFDLSDMSEGSVTRIIIALDILATAELLMDDGANIVNSKMFAPSTAPEEVTAKLGDLTKGGFRHTAQRAKELRRGEAIILKAILDKKDAA